MLPGALVFHGPDTGWRVARNLFVVLGAAKADEHGKPRLRVKAVGRAVTWGINLSKMRAVEVPASDLVPVEAFGMRLVSTVRNIGGGINHRVVLARDPALPVEPGRVWGDGSWFRNPDTENCATVDDDRLFELIAARHCGREAA